MHRQSRFLLLVSIESPALLFCNIYIYRMDLRSSIVEALFAVSSIGGDSSADFYVQNRDALGVLEKAVVSQEVRDYGDDFSEGKSTGMFISRLHNFLHRLRLRVFARMARRHTIPSTQLWRPTSI